MMVDHRAQVGLSHSVGSLAKIAQLRHEVFANGASIVHATFFGISQLGLPFVVVYDGHFSPVNGILHIGNGLRMKVSVVIHSKLSSKLVEFSLLFMLAPFSFAAFKLLSQQIIVAGFAS